VTYSLTFSIDYLPAVGMNTRTHWRSRHTETQAVDTLVAHAVGARKPAAPLKRAMLTLIRKSSVRPDYDGLVQSFKHVVDALVTIGVLEDDSMEHTGQWDCRWEKAAPKAGQVVVTVREVEQ
jgi:Holliday junction resolvase RusA-like endonuclease